MTDYFVGPGGNDGSAGTSWATRKLTLNGAEDIPVAAGDDVYVGPGVYRETLTCDVSGSVGSEIAYIADVTGIKTDGVGGVVRITGSGDDQSVTRTYAVAVGAHDYRVFRGFRVDMTSVAGIGSSASGPTNITIEDCVFIEANNGVYTSQSSSTDWTVNRCMFAFLDASGVNFGAAAAINDAGHVVENCFFYGCGVNNSSNIYCNRIGGVTVRNCTITGSQYGVRTANFSGGETALVVENCIFSCIRYALHSNASGDITEDYNTFFQNATDRTNVSVGSNSLTYPALFESPLLFSGAGQVSGFQFPWWLGALSAEWSQVAAIAGNSEPTEDLLGIVRPTTAAKCSWGAVQCHNTERETGTTYDTSAASIKLSDAGIHQVFVPVANESTTITVRVYREANYAGTNPRLVVKQPGQADDTTTDAAAVSQWNLLTTTLTPSADTDYVIVELQSLNTATSGSYAVYFDQITVS